VHPDATLRTLEAGDDLRDRHRRGVGRDDRLVRGDGLGGRQDLVLDIHAFDDGLDDQIRPFTPVPDLGGGGQPLLDATGYLVVELAAFDTGADVEVDALHRGVELIPVEVDQGGAGTGDGRGDVGDASAHDAGADDGDRCWCGHVEPPGSTAVERSRSTVGPEPKRHGPTGRHPLPGTAGHERYARRLMADTTERTAPRRTRAPQWLYEGVDLVQQRQRALLLTFGLIVVVAAVVTVAAPDVLPPRPLVGAAVAVAALLLALAVLIALDAASIKVRGPRHIRAAGGELVAVLPAEPSATGADDLARAIQDARPPGRTLLLGVAAATGDGKRVGRWAQVVARSLAEQGLSVLSLDLTADGGDHPGFLEVVRHGHKLSEVVDLDPDVRLATLGPGRDTTEALRAFNEAGRWIPRDLDVLLVALPMAASRAVVRASLSLDQLLIVAERDRTSRVELIAGLDATEAVGTHSQVILIDDAYATYLGIGAVEARTEPEPPQDDELESDPELDELLGHASGALVGEQDEEDDAIEVAAAAEAGTDFDAEPLGGPDVEPEPVEEPGSDPSPEPELLAEPELDGGPEAESPTEPDSEPTSEHDRPADERSAELGVRDVQVEMDAAAAAALADISANAGAEDDLDSLEQPRGVHDGDASDPAEDHQEDHQDDEPDAPSDELTVHVHRPEPLDEDESTLEVERPAEVDDAVAASSPEPIEMGTTGMSPTIDLNEIEAEDEEDLLNATARLSLLMDEVSDRDANGEDERP
jgi:hypothetical protein